MRRLWPSSLYGQILLVAAAALLFAQCVNTAMLMTGAQARLKVEAASMLIGRVSNLLERQRIQDDERRENERRRRRLGPIALEISAAPSIAKGFKSDADLEQRASEYLLAIDPQLSSIHLRKGALANLPDELRAWPMRRWLDGPITRNRREQPREALLLSMKMKDGRWINAAAPIRPLGMEPALVLLFQTLILYLAVLLPLALVARRIARPLQALTERVTDIGLGSDTPPMEPRGPSDVRELIEAFNSAEARLSSLLTEKDVMLGAIGHDLKTPLASLRVRIENVEDDVERDKMAATVDEMVRILDDILILARLGKSAEEVQLTDLSALVETVISEFPDGAKIEFANVAERSVAPLRAVLIRRALRNLVSNALHYGGNALVRIEQNPGNVALVVEDNGPGIPADQIAAMFEPFARADESRNRSSGGSGLGLTIARAIAHVHHGSLIVENREQGGLRATLRIPVAGGLHPRHA
jgi:signal transduction histidine kinase